MKNFARRLALLALAVPLLFSVAVRAQELTQADKKKALQLLETSKKMVLDATKDLSNSLELQICSRSLVRC
jgi:hypothetical protein